MIGRVEGRVALVSGAARGQGEAHARLLVTGTELVIDNGYLALG